MNTKMEVTMDFNTLVSYAIKWICIMTSVTMFADAIKAFAT